MTTKDKVEERNYAVYFSEGNKPEYNMYCYRVKAFNRDEAYDKARKLLEKECEVKGSPYFFIKEL
jgi:hypothetical protein